MTDEAFQALDSKEKNKLIRKAINEQDMDLEHAGQSLSEGSYQRLWYVGPNQELNEELGEDEEEVEKPVASLPKTKSKSSKKNFSDEDDEEDLDD